MSPALHRTRLVPPTRRHDGFTVVEAAVAGAIIVLFLTSLFALNSTVMRLLGAAHETANASQHLQQRVEQVRLANWSQITDPVWVQSNLLNNQTYASSYLPNAQETLTVSAYVSPSSVAPSKVPAAFMVSRDANGNVTVSPAGYSSAGVMATQEMVQVDLTVTWSGWTRTRNRALTTMVSRWGVSK